MQIRIEIDNGSCLGTIYHNGKAKVMMVDDVLVDQDKRRMGKGTLLMKKVIDIAKENQVDSIELVVGTNNEPAKGLYRKAGFSKTDKEYYRLILNHFP